MTPKQKKVFNFIRSTFIEGGISPTYTEIMEALNIKSKSVVAHYLNALEKEGKIKINRVKARGIEIEDDENTKLKTENKWYSEQLNEAVKEISQLKEVLKGAKEIIEWYKADCGYKDIPTEVTLQHINQVLGEE